MQWIYAVESHLLGFIERTGGRADEKEMKQALDIQKDELIEIERYYARAATKAARIVYFWGMVAGAAVSAALGTALAFALWYGDRFDPPNTLTTQTFFLCFVAGTMGAFISVLMRMSSNSFRVDYEVGRSTIRRLGSFRPGRARTAVGRDRRAPARGRRRLPLRAGRRGSLPGEGAGQRPGPGPAGRGRAGRPRARARLELTMTAVRTR